MRIRPVVAVAAALASLGLAPSAESPRSAPIEVVITEGTNMAAALSPDRGTLALDLLGRIWTLPADGGTATPITDPFGDARQPQWSPDGRRIVFQAYWAGDYDVWVVDADGGNLGQLTTGPFDDREPSWAPDGASVLFASDRAGSYDVWEVVVASGETRRRTDAAGNEYTPTYAPDGRRFAYVTDGPDPGVWVDGAGAPTRIVGLGDDDGYSPAWSPDGASLVYVRIGAGESGLYLAAAGGQLDEGTRITRDDEDVFPFRASWVGDGSLIYTSDGRVRRAPVAGGRASDIPFRASVTLDRPSYRKRLRSFETEEPQRIKGIVSPALSPDGETVAFVALGDLWTMEIGTAPVKITDNTFTEVDPAWAPDGTRLAYATDREGQTNVVVRDVTSGVERVVTEGGGAMPAWSPDGTEIAYAGGQGPNAGVRVVTLASGVSRTIRTGLNGPGRPTWAPDGRSVAISALRTYSSRFREGVNHPLMLPTDRVISDQQPDLEAWVAQAGHAGDVGAPAPITPQVGERWLNFAPHASFQSRGTDGPIWSPNGRLMTYVASGVLWVVPVASDGGPVGPATRLNNELSSDPSWSGDSRSILYLTTDRLRLVSLDDGDIQDVPVPLTWQRTQPVDRYVVHAGSLFDGLSSRLRRNVDIVVEGRRIVRVTEHEARLHEGRLVDASDGVVSPGLIEMHMHGGLGGGEQVGRQWLSYGITTVRTPAADPYEMAEYRESGAIGRRVQPRLFGTGFTIDGSRIYYGGAPALTSAGQVELGIQQAKDLSFDVLKTYVRLSDAMQRRVIDEAHALGIPVTSHELYPGVAYGADGVEHVRGTSRRGYSTKVTDLNRSYDDVVELLGRSGMTITPTVGIYGSYALLAEDDPALFDDPRVETFIPWASDRARRGGDPDVRRRLVTSMATLGRRVIERGGTVVVGTDSPILPQGLSLIAEMQALVQYGGMSTIDVMRATTSVSAEAMGYGDELGVVREGMLADLVVFGGDPLRDIRAVRDVRVVITDGRVYPLEELLRRPR